MDGTYIDDNRRQKNQEKLSKFRLFIFFMTSAVSLVIILPALDEISREAYAQGFPYKISAIPLAYVLLNLVVLIFLFALVAKFLKGKKTRAMAGIVAFLTGLGIAASLPITEAVLIHVGDKSTLDRLYCDGGLIASGDSPPASNDPSRTSSVTGARDDDLPSSTMNSCAQIISLTQSDVDANPVLKPMIVDSQYYKPRYIGYLQEWTVLYTINAAAAKEGISQSELSYNLNNYGHWIILQYNEDDYYTFYLRHVDQDHEKEWLTFFTPELILWNAAVTFFFYVLVWKLPITVRTKEVKVPSDRRIDERKTMIAKFVRGGLGQIGQFLVGRSILKTVIPIAAATIAILALYSYYLDSYCLSHSNDQIWYCWLDLLYVRSVPYDMLHIAYVYLVGIIVAKVVSRLRGNIPDKEQVLR